MSYVVIHYDEIALKSGNRQFFENRLRQNIHSALQDLDVSDVQRLRGRMLLELGEDAPWPEVSDRLSKVFGIAYFAKAETAVLDVDAWKEVAAREAEAAEFETFRIRARRTNKAFGHTSQQIGTILGSHVQELTGKRVNLSRADWTFYVDVLDDRALLYAARVSGPGGLPVGASGRVVSLLSGGIDSPVATWLLMKRGTRAICVHFHSAPVTSRASQDKVRSVLETMSPYQGRMFLMMVPFLDVQREITTRAPEHLRVVLYRRMMMRIAEEVARSVGAHALVTGESVGQVASQTLENIETIDAAVAMPVLRPLIGMDKVEIVRKAEAIGTFETSILPEQDCCQLFIPRRPATRSTPDEATMAESSLDMPALVRQALEGAEIQSYRPMRKEWNSERTLPRPRNTSSRATPVRPANA